MSIAGFSYKFEYEDCIFYPSEAELIFGLAEIIYNKYFYFAKNEDVKIGLKNFIQEDNLMENLFYLYYDELKLYFEDIAKSEC